MPVLALVTLVSAPYARDAEPAPAGPPAAESAVPDPPAPDVRPGKPKGAWQGEYPVPKPALPEGPAAPATDAGAPPAPDAGTERSGEPEPQAPAPH